MGVSQIELGRILNLTQSAISHPVQRRRALEEARRAKKAQDEARKQAELEAEERARREAAEREAETRVQSELYEGTVRLAVVPPIDSGQVRELEEHLRQVQGLRLVLVGGSAEGGNEIVVSIEKPTPLVSVLREMSPVEEVAKRGKEIQITLKAKQL